jgi:dihydroorotase
MRTLLSSLLVGALAATLGLAQTPAGSKKYDLLLKGGHVIDPKNNINRVMDVAIAAGKIAAVAPNLAEADATRVADVRGLYVTPGLIDIHVHVYAGTGIARAYTGDLSVYPDGFTFRTGVTTVVDAGTAGYKNFPDFRQRVIDRAKTRVFALINIVSEGMGPAGENDPNEMKPEEAAKVAMANKDIVVGFKTAHYSGQGWPSVDGAIKAASIAKLPVMVDFGYVTKERNLDVLLRDKLRPKDIYTHCYSGHREELVDGKVNPAMIAGRQRGIFFDVGHGGGSFYWNVAVPAAQQKFWPDSISTDLHTGSMNSGMKSMADTMSKILALGAPLAEVIKMSTWNPANQINHPELGHISVGAEADVAVLNVAKGNWGLLDSAGARLDAKERIIAEVTIKGGQVVYDLNGRAATDYRKFTYRPRENP